MMKFSVIIPAYCAEKYITHCLSSIINQDYPSNEYEVIIVDDCSPDGQNDIINRYIGNDAHLSIIDDSRYHTKKSPLIRLIKHDANKKQGGARNTGLRAAQGEWIIFVDADDYWCRRDVLNHFSEIIDRFNDIDIVESFTHIYVTDRSETNFQKPISNSIKCYSGREYILKSGHYTSCIWRSAYKKSYITKFRFRENVFFEDSDWRLNVMKSATKIVEIDFPFYAYVNNPSSTTRGKNIDAFYANIDSNLELQKIFSQCDDSELRQDGYSRIKSNLFSWFKISTDYNLKDSMAVIKYALSTSLFDGHNYVLSFNEIIAFNSLKHFPFLTLSVVKNAVYLKRLLHKLINK